MNIRKLLKKDSQVERDFSGLRTSRTYYFTLLFCILGVGIAAATITTINLRRVRLEPEGERLISQEEIKGNILADNGDLIEDNIAQPIHAGSSNETPLTNNMEVTAQDNEVEKLVELPSIRETTNTTNSSKNSVASVTSNSARLTRPVLGNVIKGFAMDKLVFSSTLEEWTTHSGLDIACEKGTPVKAADGGVVSEIKNDPRYGITIIIEHSGGLRTVYANLAGSDMVHPNQQVKKGDVIGGVGDTALFESKMEPHLHFEVWEGYRPVDPEKYLP